MELGSPKGLTKQLVEDISRRKNEPEWMLKYRLEAFEVFSKTPLPKWGDDLSEIDFKDLCYYVKPKDKIKTSWEAEKDSFGGTGAQFESEVIYHSLQKELAEKGVIFESTESALQKYPEIFKKHFGTVVPLNDNKFAALNSAAWSGGSFVYIPKNTKVDLPLQAYFRINTQKMGQFERTLIIADEGAQVHYMEGCTAYSCPTESLHAAVVEIIAKKGAKIQYTTIQNWSKNIYNLVTKRAHAHKDAHVSWLDCNLGSKLTMKYPAIFLKETGASGEIQSLAFAGKGQHQDAGAKIFHMAPKTTSKIVSKSISKDGGKNTYRGVLKVDKGCKGTKSHVSCNALLLDKKSISNTYPLIRVEEDEVSVAHEATVSRIEESQLFYLMSRGLSKEEAVSSIVNGFANPIIKQLPMDYALELNRLLELEIE